MITVNRPPDLNALVRGSCQQSHRKARAVIEGVGPGATLNDALTAPRGTALANQFIARGFFSEAQRPALIDGKTGVLTKLAKDRIGQALLGQFNRFPASLKNKLECVAAPLATVENDPAWNLVPDVCQANALIEYLNALGITNVGDAVAQQSIFPGTEAPECSERAIALAKLIRDGKPNAVVAAFRKYVNSKAQRTRLRAARRKRNSLALWAERLIPRPFCASSLEEPAMFGESTPRVNEVYENAEGEFGRQGSFFSRALREPGKQSLADYRTPEELFVDAHARFQARRANRPGVVWLNRPAAEVLRQALGEDEPVFSGVHLDRSDIDTLERIERLAARIPAYHAQARVGLESAKAAAARRQTEKELASSLGGALDSAAVLREFLESLSDALRTGFRRDSDVVAVVGREMGGTRRLADAVRTLRHETWHRVMDALGIDTQSFSADPLVRAGRDRLANNAQYLRLGRLPQRSEIPAYIAAGQWLRLGYDLDQATQVFAKYPDLLLRRSTAKMVLTGRSKRPTIELRAEFMDVVEGNSERLPFNLFSEEERNLAEQLRLAKAYRAGGQEALRTELSKLNPEASETSNLEISPIGRISPSSTPEPTTK